MKKIPPAAAGAVYYVFSLLYLLLMVSALALFQVPVSIYFGGRFIPWFLDIPLYLLLMVPFYFMGRSFFPKEPAKTGKGVFLFFLFLTVVLPLMNILLPLVKVLLSKELLFGSKVFVLSRNLGISEIDAFALIYGAYSLMMFVLLRIFVSCKFRKKAWGTREEAP